jgi:DNA polymerase I-like protein with 3'-5' exonuclease and polymerase domains
MKHKVSIVRDIVEWEALGASESKPHVADVETFKTDPKEGKLLGVAISPVEGTFADGSVAAYIVLNEYQHNIRIWTSGSSILPHTIGSFLTGIPLIGHNYTYDKMWLDSLCETPTRWIADSRLMWHMSDNPRGSKGYGLKDAQVEVLGWVEAGDVELDQQVRSRGGSLDRGDHYLADTEVLAYYAGLDAFSTRLLYNARKPHFDEHDQWGLLEEMMRYSWMLQENTSHGVRVDEAKLRTQLEELQARMAHDRSELFRMLEEPVRTLETRWLAEKLASYSDTKVGQRFKDVFAADVSRHPRFNFSSDKQKSALFYGVMGLPVMKTVKPRKDKRTGRKIYSDAPATSFEAISLAVANSGRPELEEMIAAYSRSEKSEILHNSFVAPWVECTRNGRIHPPFNPCGTVSYRLSGYRPYFLNLPFEERELMECFLCDEGYGGVHADLVSVEPTLTAHYSQDPHLLKVFRDGLGDVYLDLALTLFPNDRELREGYNPNAPATTEVKERFKKRRKVAKVVQLAVQYTGTGYTVSNSLRCTLEEAEELVERYWKHFEAVRICNDRLIRLHAKKGFLTNAVGRVFRMPYDGHKDTPNRFFQSGGHDILRVWVQTIFRTCQERGIKVRPVILDLHDATSLQAPLDQVGNLEEVFVDSLTEVNERVKLSVPVRMEMKRFSTLAGLKMDELKEVVT